MPRFDLQARRMIDPGAFIRLLRLLDSEKIDIIHAQLQDANIMAAAAHFRTGIPVVTTRHLIGDDVQNWRRRLRNHIEHFATRHGIARVIGVSNATRDNYARMLNLPASRLQTVYNGIDLQRFGPAADKATTRAQLGLPAAGPLVTFVGVLRPGKGHDVCIEAARHLPDVQFLLVGDGKPPFRAMLEENAKGLEDRVHFLGQRMDVPAILSASDMLILPSDSEALPTVLIEAGASALPAIATTVGGCGEIVQDGKTGLLIPPQDPAALVAAINKLAADPALAEQMGQAAYQFVHEQFTLPGQAEALTQLYETVVADNK